ncbi:MAG: ABC transporter substrate-binding protein [Sulfuriflexus sp.]|nr:ABC transporter substrate-binding protein [Sulfuriflexus sp.]
MNKLLSILFIVAAFCFTPITVSAQSSGEKQYTVVMLLWRGMTDAERGFIDYLKTENVNINYIVKNCEKDKTRLSDFIDEVKAIKPDLVYTFGTTVTRRVIGALESRSADKNILDIPVVFNIVSDPVGAKLTASMESSKSNFTGVSHSVPIDTQIKVMKKVKPLNKIAVIYNPLERNSMLTVAALKIEAAKQNFSVIEAPLEISSNGKPKLDSIFNNIARVAQSEPDFLYLPPDSFLIANADSLITTANRYKMASFSSTEAPIRKSGALLGIVSTYYSVGKFAGYKAKQILLDKVEPASLPIETLKKFSLLVNISTAKKIDFFPPVSMLAVAEVVK